MGPALRFAVELPPVPSAVAPAVPGAVVPVSLEPWWQLARAAVRAGAEVVWFSGDQPVDGPAASEGVGADGSSVDRVRQDDPAATATARWCDACTIAAAALQRFDGALCGVVSALPADRHAAVLAREVTTLDVASAGRAALLLRWAGSSGTFEPSSRHRVACEYLGEAVAVCRAVFVDDDPVFEGRHLHVAGAVNRPPPSRPGGPPILVEVPAHAAGASLAGEDAGISFLLGQVLAASAAIVCSDDSAEVASWRARADDAAGVLWAGRDPDTAPEILCRTTVHWTDGTAAAPVADVLGRGRVDPGRLESARTAGADGIVVRLAGRPVSQVGHTSWDGDVTRITEDLAACFDPWRR